MNEAATVRPPNDQILRFFFSKPALTARTPAIFLDRDGVINERIPGGYVTSWSEFRFTPGIADQLAALSQLGLPMLVVSNQAGVGKNLVSRDDLAEITEQFVADLRHRDARIDAVYYCPHTQEARCACRKPAPGLLKQAARDWRINLERSVLVGDSAGDLQAARACQCPAILLTHEGSLEIQEQPPDAPPTTVSTTNELAACVRRLLAEATPAPGNPHSPT